MPRNLSGRSEYGIAISPQGPGLAQYARQVNEMARRDRQHQLNMNELEYLAARQALGLNLPGRGGRGGASGADQFLQRWEQELGGVRGVYNQALQGLQGVYGDLRTASGAAQRLGDLAGRVEQEYQGYLTEMQPLQQEMTQLATEEATARRGLLGQLPALTAYDPEAAAGRAIADVSQQFGQARQAEARRMASMGIDPTSGRALAMGQRWGGAEALGRAMGATSARQQERQRAGAMTMQAMGLLDPGRAATTALNIRTGANQLLGQAGALLGQQAQMLGNVAQTRANVGRSIADIGGSMATHLAAPYAEMAGIQMGLAGQGMQAAQNWLANRPSGGGGGLGLTVASNPGGPLGRVNAIEPTWSGQSKSQAMGGTYFNMT